MSQVQDQRQTEISIIKIWLIWKVELNLENHSLNTTRLAVSSAQVTLTVKTIQSHEQRQEHWMRGAATLTLSATNISKLDSDLEALSFEERTETSSCKATEEEMWLSTGLESILELRE